MDFVTGFGGSAATETGKFLLPKIKKHIGYLYKYKENVENLKVARDKLNAKRTDASRFADQTDRKFQDVSSSNANWGSKADQLHQKAQKIISQNNISCLKPWSSYASSKQAWELTQEINEMVKNAPDFGTAFDRPSLKLGPKFNLRGFMEFNSRLTILNGVYEALKDEKVSICSICGMGGIGKTTLVKKLIQRVEADFLFDKVAMVTVSQNPNFEKIQNDIIEQLGLKIDERGMAARANKLNAWLTSNRTLLVLDDVWWQLHDEDFEEIGIPLMSSGCKTVVTSRNVDECEKMRSQPNFLINVLEDGEAWDLFIENAGKCVEELNLQETARKITDECDGLPIAIVTIATSLKDKPRGVWNDSLLHLQKSKVQRISGMERMYSRIQLSYDLLKDEEAQSCFRLCCLFPEDFDVPVENLILCGKGLELFENVDSISEARDRVESIIHKLKKSFLLLDAEKDGNVKMHDIVRDFAISISSKDKHPYIVRHDNETTKWPETAQYENCSAISFVFDTMQEHPIDLICPKLKLLQLSFDDGLVGLPIGIFEGMKELQVVDLQVPSLLQPLSMLKKLRTLVIDETSDDWDRKEPPNIGDLLGHGDLKNLEAFVFFTRRPCNDFPMEIGLLCNMRLLDFNMLGFKYMPPGVLSKLVKLEELLLPWEFMNWGCKEEGGERVNASLNEIESLPLTRLKIGINEGSILGEKLVKNLKRFEILMGSYSFEYGHGNRSSSATLGVVEVDACNVTKSWMIILIRKSERLKLQSVGNLKNLKFLQSAQYSGSPQLKNMKIVLCDEMECLIDTIAVHTPFTFFSRLENLELEKMNCLKEICHSPYLSKIYASCFNNLIRILLFECQKLKHVFPLSVARELKQLQSMVIWDCGEMEKVFYKEEVDNGNQVVSSVQLSTTPTIVETASTSTTTLMKTVNEKLQLTPKSSIRGLLSKGKQPKIVSNQEIVEANNAKEDGKEVDNVIMSTIIFPQLQELILEVIPKLRVVYDGNEAIELPSSKKLIIDNCNNMEAITYGALNAPNLKKININGIECRKGQNLNAILKKAKLNREKLDTGNDTEGQ